MTAHHHLIPLPATAGPGPYPISGLRCGCPPCKKERTLEALGQSWDKQPFAFLPRALHSFLSVPTSVCFSKEHGSKWRNQHKAQAQLRCRPAERPTKHLKPESSTLTPGDATPANGTVYDVEDEEDTGRVMPIGPAQADSPEWQATIEKVVKSVVSIHFCQTCSFDTDLSMSSQATGFVVDAERGYILTNRHVVCAGPFWGYCIFDNHEESDVRPVYRDPVHDFGILKFDPKAIRYMELTELKLRPEAARVGCEIRVVGNDAGEKLSILSGVISRLDRNAPEYGDGYCDFNTNYIQAAAAASGGSSGSPVVNIDGHAIALQAGGRADGAATDYFLPLDRPLRALECIRRGEPVARGTIQTQWILKPFDECRRLGLTPEWEAAVRKASPHETSMLVAEIILPEGPADGKLEEGDVLLQVNGELLTQFIRLDDILDSSVGKTVRLLVQRGGQNVEVECEVGDLHAITPDRFVTVAGSTFHNLSYQQARLYAIATRGVYVCEAAGSFKLENTLSGWIIDAVDKRPTRNLDEFIEVMKTIPDRARVVISYRHIRDLHTRGTSIVYIDRHWHPKMRMAIRNDETGLWDFSDLADPVPAETPVPTKADFIQLDGVSQPAVADIVRSFVRVSCTMPLKLDGYPQAKKTGFGLVIDAEKGLVVVSRAIVPYNLCDINITVADSIIVAAKVIFLHPLQNYTIIQYDPSLVQAPVQSAKLSTEYIKQGQETIFVGFNQNFRIVVAKTAVTDITTVSIPANASAPRYRAINLDAITVDTGLSGQCTNGVLIGEDGVVQALWLNYLGERTPSSHKDVEYHLGFATPALLPVTSKIQQGIIPKLRILNMESYVVQMSQARIMGVSEEWIQKVAQANPSRHQLFMVRKVDCPPPQLTSDADSLQEGDIILTLDGQLITRVSELDKMYEKEVLDALIVRNGQEMHLKLPTVPTEDLETDRAVVFCGAVLQKPHHAVRQQISKLHSEVYVSARSRGSPAYQYGLAPTNFITAVNGVPTPNLDSFVREVGKIPDNTYFRLRAVTFDNVPWVVTMKKNDHYFPMSEYIKDPSQPLGWRTVSHDRDRHKDGITPTQPISIQTPWTRCTTSGPKSIGWRREAAAAEEAEVARRRTRAQELLKAISLMALGEKEKKNKEGKEGSAQCIVDWIQDWDVDRDTTRPGISGLYQVVGTRDLHTDSSVGQETDGNDNTKEILRETLKYLPGGRLPLPRSFGWHTASYTNLRGAYHKSPHTNEGCWFQYSRDSSFNLSGNQPRRQNKSIECTANTTSCKQGRWETGSLSRELPYNVKRGTKDYISPLLPSPNWGQKNVWFSKAKYNAGKKVMDYFPDAGESGNGSARKPHAAKTIMGDEKVDGSYQEDDSEDTDIGASALADVEYTYSFEPDFYSKWDQLFPSDICEETDDPPITISI
ncbi:putative nuclear serine protease HtrA2/Nma111 [Aspergillus novofumigatus IBT 16806]|uniref:Pro-apoptotic serine protease NMA111 n=1 Tax=Aspergillus novofumigatus (strain IBT 16806) TaxID=1392255 RepID=A0A2I1CBG4_ASPN1|nr:trypsin-like serine protease [Aspergillus novofumigatus IBT 16806]PKX94954.1 trypsin-like serine protease [Aspergillus novofumigatus IBT 16806]